MQFAINWSPQAQNLLRAGKIQIDRWKCPDWDDMIAKAREDQLPVYVHFPLVIGRGSLEKTDWARVEAMMHDTQTPHVNLHLEPVRSAVGALSRDALFDLCAKEISAVVDRFGGDRVVVENVPYRTEHTDKFADVVDPTFITDLLTQTGARFLFDIGHAQISAYSLAHELYGYLRAMPLDRLGEIHTAGVTRFTQAHIDTARQVEGFDAYFQRFEGKNPLGMLMDHFGMGSDSDWESFVWVMDRVRDGSANTPRFVSYEYGGTGAPFAWRSESDVIARDVPRFYSIVHDGIKTI